MESLQARIDSFSKSKRLKNPSKPSTSVTAKWSHPKSFKATPDTLAEAGFYYNPSYGDRDNATCYMCGKNIGEWEEDDDPFDIHWEKCGWSCAWASVRCALREDMDRYGRFVFHDKTRVPTSKVMEKARLQTYSSGGGWMHDKSKNHGANSKKMAQAGFVYTPQYTGDDLATCLYCNVSLSGWEPEDEPMEEHKKRETRTGNACAFLVFADGGAVKPPSKKSSKPPSRTASKSKHQDLVMPTKTHDGDPDGDEASDSAASTAPASTKKGRKGRSASTTRESTAKGSRLERSTSRKNVDEEVEEQGIEEAPKKRGRPPSNSVAHSSSKLSDEDVEEEFPPPTRKRAPSRARSKSVARSVPQSEDEIPAPVAKHGRKPSSSRMKSKAVESEVEVEEEAPLSVKKRAPSRAKSKSVTRSVPPSEDEAQAPTTTRKTSSSRAKSKALESEAEVEADLIPRKSSRSRSKALASESDSEVDAVSRKPSRTVKPRPTIVMEEDEEPPQEEAPKKPVNKACSKARAVDSEIEDEPVKPLKAVKSKHSSKAAAKSQLERALTEEDDSEIEEPVKVVKAAKSSPSKISSKSKPKPAPVEGDDSEEEEPIKHAKATKFKPASKSSSGLKAQPAPAPIENDDSDVVEEEKEEEEEEEEEEEKPMKPEKAAKFKPGPKASSGKKTQSAHVLMEDNDSKMEEEELVKPAEASKSKPPSKPSSVPSAGHAPAFSEDVPAQSGLTIEDEDLDHRSTPLKKKVSAPSPPAPPLAEEEKYDDDGDVTMHDLHDIRLPPSTPPRPATSMPFHNDINLAPSAADVNVTLAQPSSTSRLPAAATTHNETQPLPSAPPRPAAYILPEHVIDLVPSSDISPEPINSSQPSAAATLPEPSIIPPLSKLPFTPLHTITDAELDMTVEEWIRYQMEVEYDKFRRDGERELLRFRKKAEEVRKIIEGL